MPDWTFEKLGWCLLQSLVNTVCNDLYTNYNILIYNRSELSVLELEQRCKNQLFLDRNLTIKWVVMCSCAQIRSESFFDFFPFFRVMTKFTRNMMNSQTWQTWTSASCCDSKMQIWFPFKTFYDKPSAYMLQLYAAFWHLLLSEKICLRQHDTNILDCALVCTGLLMKITPLATSPCHQWLHKKETAPDCDAPVYL